MAIVLHEDHEIPKEKIIEFERDSIYSVYNHTMILCASVGYFTWHGMSIKDQISQGNRFDAFQLQRFELNHSETCH